MKPLVKVVFVSMLVTFMFFSLGAEESQKTKSETDDKKTTKSEVVLKDFQVPAPEIEMLQNGLQVAWFYSDRLPLIDVALLVKSGYRDDLPGKSGTSQILSQLLDRGAAGLSAVDMARQIENLGAGRYQSADDDTFSIGLHGLSIDAEKLIGILGSIALSPNLTKKDFESERLKLVQRIEHIGDYASSLANMTYFRAISNHSSYARGSVYSIKELSKLKVADVQAYYKKHFTPHNSILMVVGRYDQEKIRKLIKEKFGKWKGPEPKRNWKNYKLSKIFRPNKSSLRPVVWLIDRKGVSQSEIRLGFRGPSIRSGDYYALSVVNALFGEIFNSRLNRSIRDEMGLVYSIGSAFSYSRDISRFTVSTACEASTTAKVIKRLVSLLHGLRTDPITQTEVDTSKQYLLGSFPVGNSTLRSVASRWLAGVVYDLGSGYLNEYLPKINSVTHADVAKAVRTHFVLNELVVVVAGDAKQLSPQLKKAGFTIRRVTAQDLF